MMMAWVGYTTIDSLTKLQHFLQSCQTTTSQYFMRWLDRGSVFNAQPSLDSLSPMGQLFDSDRELRWRFQGGRYSVLLLSNVDTPGAEQPLTLHDCCFQPIGNAWKTQTFNAHVYPETETRLPAPIATNGVNIHQRHFIDRATATVHFTALVVASSASKKEDS